MTDGIEFSLCMAAIDDRDRAVATAREALIHHPRITEVVIADNRPDSEHGRSLRDWCRSMAGQW